MNATVVAVAAVVVAIGVIYMDRKSLGAHLNSIEQSVVIRIAMYKAALKLKIKADVAVILSDVKAWAEKENADGKAVLAQIEGRLKQIL